MTPLEALVDEAARRAHAAIEQACEAALQGGEHGVRVDWGRDGTVTARVDPEVPYGHIHEHRP